MTGSDRESRAMEIWERIYKHLRDEVDEVVFRPWLSPLTFVESYDDVVRLALPSRFRRDWVANTYEEYILAKWREEDDNITKMEFVVQPQSHRAPTRDGQDNKRAAAASAQAVDRVQKNQRRESSVNNLRAREREEKQPEPEPVRQQLGKVGVWSRSPYFFESRQATDLAVAAEELGYSALWIPGFDGGHIFERCGMALEVTSRLTVATGILNIWRHEPGDVARAVARLRADNGGRFLLGLGGSHKFLIGDAYDKISPLAKMRNYLDELDGEGLPPEDRLLGALGPKMLALSAERTLGTHPCFIPPDFTAAAREVLGEEPLLMPEVTVILESNPTKARAYARKFASLYFKGPNYANMLRRFGFTDEDFADYGSDRLIDAVVAWGDPETIAARVRAHLDAGADHVAIQSRGHKPEVDVWRELAPRLLG